MTLAFGLRFGVRNHETSARSQAIGAVRYDAAEDRGTTDSPQIRARLWAQSLLRLKRAMDEIYLLCEYESEANCAKEVRAAE